MSSVTYTYPADRVLLKSSTWLIADTSGAPYTMCQIFFGSTGVHASGVYGFAAAGSSTYES